MTDPATPTAFTGSEAPSDRGLPLPAIGPGAYACPAQLIEPIQGADLATLAQLAAQVLQDPLKVQQLSDRVFELLQHDLTLQQERIYGYGRRL
ncbi:MAG: hypothetical protein NW220_02550 [Leptolyngbyaceae cyanobacterium bins.349]|nr:hypothetical protein [Leptolyngbyaceae cyanobacterium bins.349]